MPGWSCGTGQVAGARPGANPGSGRLDRTSHLWDTSPSLPPPTQQCCWSVPGKCQGGGARGREAPVWERQISDPPNPALQPMLSTAGACPQAAQESLLCVSRSESPESDTGTRVHRGHGEQGSHMTRAAIPRSVQQHTHMGHTFCSLLPAWAEEPPADAFLGASQHPFAMGNCFQGIQDLCGIGPVAATATGVRERGCIAEWPQPVLGRWAGPRHAWDG